MTINRSWLPAAVKLGIAMLLLGAALYLLDWPALRESLQRIHPSAFVVAVLLLLPENALLALRWHYVVRADIPLPVAEHTRRFFIAIFVSSFTPATIGGDFYRFLNLRKKARNNWQMAGLIVRERLIGLAGYALFYLVCAVAYLSSAESGDAALGEAYWLALICFVAGLVGLYPARRLFDILRERLPLFRGGKGAGYGELISVALDMGGVRQILGLQCLSLLTCGMWTLSIVVIARDLEIEVGFLVLGMAGVLTDLVRQIPISIQGIGVRESTFAVLLWAMGLSLEQGFILGLASYLAVTIAVVAVGAIGFLMPARPDEPDGAAVLENR